MTQGWQKAFQDRLGSEVLQWDEQSLHEFSKDFHTFSPVLTRELEGRIGQCVASPRTDEELDGVLGFAAEARIPITVRGGGTGNYGQCVPLTGGIVLNLSKFQKVLEVGEGFMRVQAGTKLGKMELVARAAGQELRTLPSTFQSATIGGFLCGGFGGIGSISWGTIWDGLVRSLTIKTVEPVPRTLRVEGEAILPYIHTYGTIGVLAEVELNLAPRVEWQQWAVSFSSFEKAFGFAAQVAEDAGIRKRLVSVMEAEITPAFLPLSLPAGRAVVFLETDEAQEAAVRTALESFDGTVEVHRPPEAYHLGIGVSDFTWNHTTLWARKTDSRMTYLQIQYDPARVLDQVAALRKQHPEMRHHIEFARQKGKIMVAGLPLVPFVSEEALNQLMADCEGQGVPVANPHTADLEAGGRSYDPVKLWALKDAHDPFELLNQKKLQRPAGTRGTAEVPATPGRLRLEVTRVTAEAKGVLCLELRSADSGSLPPFTPGAHLGLVLPNGALRQYSLVNDPRESHRYVVAVALSATSRGGSRYIHSSVRRGDVLEAEAPRSNFPLVAGATRHVFVAGGIGITPMMSMIRWCRAQGLPWALIYTAHSRQRAAFLEEALALGGDRVTLHISSEAGGRRWDPRTLPTILTPGDHVYCCGPGSLMMGVKAVLTGPWEGQGSFEWFGVPEVPVHQDKPARPFEIKLRKSGTTLAVPETQSILEVLEDHDHDPPFFCRSGICRSCEVDVSSGTPDHRDFVLSEAERAEGRKVLICVSRSETPILELDL